MSLQANCHRKNRNIGFLLKNSILSYVDTGIKPGNVSQFLQHVYRLIIEQLHQLFQAQHSYWKKFDIKNIHNVSGDAKLTYICSF